MEQLIFNNDPANPGALLNTNLWTPKRDIGGLPKIRGTFLERAQNKDYHILGSILGSPHFFGKLPYKPYTPSGVASNLLFWVLNKVANAQNRKNL